MPTLKFHAIEAERLLPVSKELVERLAQVLDVPKDHVNLEVISSVFVEDGNFVPGFPIVEVHSFQRAIQVEDAAAHVVSKYMKQMGYSDSELYYVYLEQRNYYLNGEHY